MRLTSLAVAASAALIATPLFAAVTVENLSKTRFSGGAALANVFGGKAVKDGIVIKMSIDGDVRVLQTDREVELIDLTAETIWKYKLGRRGKPGRCKATTFDERREAMSALRELDFTGGQGQPVDGDSSELPDYEITINANETGAEETHAGLTGKVIELEIVVHRPGMTLEEGGGSKIDTTLVMGPKPQGWDESVDWNRRYMEAMNIDFEGMEGMARLMASIPALKKAMAGLKEKEATFDGAVLRSETTVYTMPDPRAPDQTEDGDNGVPTGIGDLGARIGGSLLRKRQEESAPPGPKETFATSTVLTSYSPIGDELLTLPDRCER